MFSLKKTEILRKGHLLDSLFIPKESITINGFVCRHSFYASPLKCVYMFRKAQNNDEPLQALFSVSKRNFKRAVKRNKLRRRIKESYRISKNDLKDLAIQKQIAITIHFSYNTNEELNFNEISSGVQTIIKEISDKLASLDN